jgi:hypothetical protein
MTRLIRNVGFVLALATAGLCASAFPWAPGGLATMQAGADTPLPPGWELCILAGVTAPATPANITDLDDWQAAEGGSTNNTAAYNPFNTQRMTDVTGAPIPGAISSNGFPAFSDWAGGCSATTATMLQPNMWPITAALRAGNVSPGAAFLATVDQSAWCAPSADGLPCYASSVLGLAGSIPATVPASSALDVYGNVASGLQTYQKAITTVSADQSVLAVREFTLAEMQTQVAAARTKLGAASHELQGFAVNEYVSTGLYSAAPLENSGSAQSITASTPKDTNGVVVQQYLGVTANNLLSRDEAATDTLKDAVQRQKDAATAAAQASVTLTTDKVAENQDLVELVDDVATLEHAGACSTVTIAAPTPSASSGSTGATTSTSTTTTTAPPSTTTTVAPTTTSTSSTTTTTTATGLSGSAPATSTTTTTEPPTTTTTATSPTTTTTTTVSASPTTPAATPAASAEAPGVSALQGCIASFAPTSGTT